MRSRLRAKMDSAKALGLMGFSRYFLSPLVALL